MVDEREDKMKTLANDILEQCQKQRLTFQETKTLLMLMEQHRQQKGANTMNKDSYTKMVSDGKNLIQILQSDPEDKRPMLSAIAGAYIDGMIAQERLAAAERPGA